MPVSGPPISPLTTFDHCVPLLERPRWLFGMKPRKLDDKSGFQSLNRGQI